MIYKVVLHYKGYSYVKSSFLFEFRDEAMDFAELAWCSSTKGQLSKVTIELIDGEEADE